jgi:hypothetical protein
VIPVAAVARPRQGIRVQATGAPALSAGTIVATAGDGQVTITQGAAPTGTITSRTLYRSTAAGQLGTAVPSFAGAYPFPDTGRTNATTYHYTLRVSDGSTSADSPQVSSTPQAAGGAGVTSYYEEDFSAGTLAATRFSALSGYATPEKPAAEVVPHPSGSGNVCKVWFRSPVASGDDVNSTINYAPNPVGGHPSGIGFGESIYVSGRFRVPPETLPPDGSFPLSAQIKLLHLKGGDPGARSWSIFPVLWGRTAPSRGWKLDIAAEATPPGVASSVRNAYGLAQVEFDTDYEIAMWIEFNTLGQPNGRLRLYWNGASEPVLDWQQVELMFPSASTATDFMYECPFGSQIQWGAAARPYDAYVMWWDIKYLSGRP